MPQEPSTFACDVCCGTTTTTTSTTPAPTTTTLAPTTTQNPVTTTSNPVTTTSGPNTSTTTTTSGPLVPCCIRIDVPAFATSVSGPFSTQPTVSIIDTEGRTVTDSNATVTIGAGVANSKIKVFNDGLCSLTGTLTSKASSGASNWNNAGIDGVCDTKCTLTYSSPGLTSAAQPLDLPSCIIMPCAYRCVADGQQYEYSDCAGTIHVWVHMDKIKSILNCVYNPWVGGYIDPDRALDAQGYPLDMYCDANTDTMNIVQVSYNTVNGYLAAAGYNQNRISINNYSGDNDPEVLSVVRDYNNIENKNGGCCCSPPTPMCPCRFYYAHIKTSQLLQTDPQTKLTGTGFLNTTTKETFFGNKWEFLFEIDNTVTARKNIGNLGVQGINSVEVFIKNLQETFLYNNNGGQVGNIAGEGKNHIPANVSANCFAYYPDLINSDCSQYHNSANVGPTNSKFTITGSEFFTTIKSSDYFAVGSPDQKYCNTILGTKNYEYNYKFIYNDGTIVQNTTAKGTMSAFSGIFGLNTITFSESNWFQPFTYKDNISGQYTEYGGYIVGDITYYVNLPQPEWYYECQYKGLSDFVARPFNLKSTGVMMTPVLDVTIKYQDLKIPQCYYDQGKLVRTPDDPNNPYVAQAYYQGQQLKAQLATITITDS